MVNQWICCQLGAREHYAVPRALHQLGCLESVVTDAWCPPSHAVKMLKQRLRERFHADLVAVDVHHASLRLLLFETWARARGLNGWNRILARNEWFQKQAIRILSGPSNGILRDRKADATECVLFAYSYAAREILRFAKKLGWKTVLGQIDPGLPEERIVARLQAENADERGRWERVPAVYWDLWREECSLADRIIVNSEWSKSALVAEGIAPEKLRVIPLAFQPPAGTGEFRRSYPAQFTAGRPLRVLFLGQVNLRKGMGPVIEAMRQFKGQPVEFQIAGPIQIKVPADLEDVPQVKWIGSVPRGATARLYQEADVFLFPTFSDGFGLTQLEAQAWKLPVIASQCCGNVVEHGRNGWILPEISAEEIASVLRRCIAEPARLAECSRNTLLSDRFSLREIGKELAGVFIE